MKTDGKGFVLIGLTAFYYDKDGNQFSRTHQVREVSCLAAAKRIIARGRAHYVGFPLFTGGGGWFWLHPEET